MRVLPDNDVIGAVHVLQLILESEAWASYTAALDVQFISFADLELQRDALDKTVWETCQAYDVVLITANRSGGHDSLDETIRTLGDVTSLPVLTIADAQRVVRVSAYAEECAFRLLDYLDRIESLRGAGRLYLP